MGVGGWKIIDYWNSDFRKLLMPQLIQFAKFNNFFCVYWFLGKNIATFVHPVWKLPNLYCHIGQPLSVLYMVSTTNCLSRVTLVDLWFAGRILKKNGKLLACIHLVVINVDISGQKEECMSIYRIIKHGLIIVSKVGWTPSFYK